MWTAVPLVFSRCTFSVKVTRRPCHAAVSSVLAQPERHHLFKCAEIKGALHLCVSASERWGDIIFLNRESALKRCLLASVRSHQGTELLFGGSRSSNGCEGKNYCFLFNKPQNNPVYRGERQRSGLHWIFAKSAQQRSVSLCYCPGCLALSYLWKSNGLLQQTSICKAPPRGGSDYQVS